MIRTKNPKATAIVIVCLLLLASVAIVFAQGATLQLSTEGDTAGHLVDNYGRSLYLNLREEGVASACYNECAANWPPLLVRAGPTAGEGLDASLIGTLQRENETTQLTYAGWPLYYYSGDGDVGVYFGQGASDEWFLLSAAGEPLRDVAPTQPEQAETPDAPIEDPPPEAEEMPADEEGGETQDEPGQEDDTVGDEPGAQEGDEPASTAGIDQELYALGQETYSSVCAACHGQNGGGGEGVRLVDNSRLGDGQHVANVVIHGFGYMPAIGAGFSDEQVAAVATYVRNSWGNEFGPVSVEEVAQVR